MTKTPAVGYPAMKGFDTDEQLTEAKLRLAMQDADWSSEAAGRYLHNLATSEVALCERMGFGLWLIDEVAGQDQWSYWSGGAPAGMQRARSAVAKAKNFGLPSGQFICSAVDLDISPSQKLVVDQFLEGYAQVLADATYKPLIYAEGLVLADGLPDGSRGYLACAGGWTGTKGFPTAQAAIVQHLPSERWGMDVDLCEINDPGVLWWPGRATMPGLVATQPAPLLADPFGALPADAKSLQNYLRGFGYMGALDGILGPKSREAIANAVAHKYGQ